MKQLLTLSLALSVGIATADLAVYAQKGRGPADRGGGPPSQGGRDQAGQGRGLENSNARTERNRGQTEDRAINDNGERKSQSSISERLESNPKLAERVRELLPTGMTLQTASVNFKNQGQFIAALHVSKNLRIPFADLKAKMIGDNAVSLGDAIQQLRPELGEAKAREEARRAEQEAEKTETLPRTT